MTICPNLRAPFPAIRSTPTNVQALARVLDTLTHQAHHELDPVTSTLFFMGDGLQRATVDGIFGLFRQSTWTPAHLLGICGDALQQTIRLSRLLDPSQAALAWQEFRNKLEVFILVKNLSSILGLSSRQFVPLPKLVEKAYTLSSFTSLWAVEGAGHYYADSYWEQKGVPHALLSEQHAPVPAKSLLMLHAGMGLAFADRLLGTLPTQASPDEIRNTLESFLVLCKTNSREGYLGAAVESLGLVTRDFYPELLAQVEQQLRQVGPEFVSYFWHGVGRALYFSRRYFLPVLGTAWRGVETEADTVPDRSNAMAGLAWAVTLVNMSQPAILENAVRFYVEPSGLADAFTDGVVSAIIVRTATTPDAQFVLAFSQHRPRSHDGAVAAYWKRRIADPSEVAIRAYYPVLQQYHAVDQVFRYQNLESLVSHLQHRNTNSG